MKLEDRSALGTHRYLTTWSPESLEMETSNVEDLIDQNNRNARVDRLFTFKDAGREGKALNMKLKKNTMRAWQSAAHIDFTKDILKPIQRVTKSQGKTKWNDGNFNRESVLKVVRTLGQKLKSFDVQASLASMARKLIEDFRHLVTFRDSSFSHEFNQALEEGYRTLAI